MMFLSSSSYNFEKYLDSFEIIESQAYTQIILIKVIFFQYTLYYTYSSSMTDAHLWAGHVGPFLGHNKKFFMK